MGDVLCAVHHLRDNLHSDAAVHKIGTSFRPTCTNCSFWQFARKNTQIIVVINCEKNCCCCLPKAIFGVLASDKKLVLGVELKRYSAVSKTVHTEEILFVSHQLKRVCVHRFDSVFWEIFSDKYSNGIENVMQVLSLNWRSLTRLEFLYWKNFICGFTTLSNLLESHCKTLNFVKDVRLSMCRQISGFIFNSRLFPYWNLLRLRCFLVQTCYFLQFKCYDANFGARKCSHGPSLNLRKRHRTEGHITAKMTHWPHFEQYWRMQHEELSKILRHFGTKQWFVNSVFRFWLVAVMVSFSCVFVVNCDSSSFAV